MIPGLNRSLQFSSSCQSSQPAASLQWAQNSQLPHKPQVGVHLIAVVLLLLSCFGARFVVLETPPP